MALREPGSREQGSVAAPSLWGAVAEDTGDPRAKAFGASGFRPPEIFGVGPSKGAGRVPDRTGPGARRHAGGTVGDVLTAFVLIDAEPARVAELAEEVASVDGVAESYSVAGQADIVAVVRVRRIEDLADVVTRRLHCLAGVTDTRTLVAFQSYSQKDLDAMWELGAELRL